MKVIHLISGGDSGGAKTHVHSLLRSLARSVDVTLVCFRDGPFAQEAAALGIDTRVYPGRFFSALGEVEELIRSEGFELIHSHGSRGNLAGALLARRTHLPVVSTVHSDWKLEEQQHLDLRTDYEEKEKGTTRYTNKFKIYSYEKIGDFKRMIAAALEFQIYSSEIF